MRIRRALPLVAAAVVLAACSSDKATGPAPDNAALILHFDSLKNSSTGTGPQVYLQFVQMLAEGSPVGTAAITIDGVSKQMHVIAIRAVGVSDGSPFDSTYLIGAWTGDGSDTAITFLSTGSQVSAFATIGDTQGTSVGGSATVTPGALGASCTPLTAPDDVVLPPTISCNLQSSVAAFSAVLEDDGPTIALPQQTVKGIRAEIEAAPPPC